MRKLMPVLLIAAILLFSCANASESLTVDAKAAVLIDAQSGRILFAKNENEMLPEASCTKIMTALIALENASLDESVTTGKNAYGVTGTSLYLSEGETLTMEQMLYGLMLRSGNDAAVAIAEHIAGSVEAFCEMMDARAEEIGADAKFKNPHGLDADGHAASALGLALIMREAMKNSDFQTITATQKKIIPWVGNEYSRVLENKNRLLSTYEGANGGKTGYTSKAGRCLVFSAKRGETELIGVVLNCPTWFDTAEKMLDYGFEHYATQTFLQEGEIAGTASVIGGDSDSVNAVADQTLSATLKSGETVEVLIHTDEQTAPVSAGQAVGWAQLMLEDEILGECTLNAESGVPAKSIASALRRIIRRWLLSKSA